MLKNTFSIPFILLMFSYLYIYPNSTFASSTIISESVITLPIEADLQVLEDHLNHIVPQYLSEINDPHKLCAEAQYIKTKGIPKCRRDGYSISCKSEIVKIKVSPNIYCDIKGWVKRDGPISLSGKAKTLTFSFPIKAQVSTEAGIRETANASAILYIHATPNIDKNWSVSVDVTPHFVWSKEPNLKLLNIIDFNLKNRVEPKLKKKIDLFIKKLPTLLSKLNIKEKIHSAWEHIQEPIKLDNKTNTYLIFRPQSASYSGFTIVNNILKMTIRTKGSTHINVGDSTLTCKKTTLCELGVLPNKTGAFNFNIPVSIRYQELMHFTNKNFSNGYTKHILQNSLPGILNVSNPTIEKSLDGNIRITAHIHYDNRSTWLKAIDVFNWFDVDGEITFKGSPKIKKQSRCLVLNNLTYDSSTNSNLFDLLVDASELEPIKSHFYDLVKYDFGQKLDEGISKANQALKKLSTDNVNMVASLQIASIEQVQLHAEHMTIYTKLSGTVKANVGL